MNAAGIDFHSIRSWRGSQDQAFEELCYQLRDPTPAGAELIKTGSPDGGLEWYVRHQNGIEWGWQAKFTRDITSLLKLMEASLKTVVQKRPNCRRLTFCIPFDLPDAPGKGERKAARQKFEDRKEAWRERIPGADRVRIELWSEGELLQRLTSDPHQRGKSWFFWNREVFSPEWCQKRLAVTVKAAGERYSPEVHVELPVAFALEGLAASDQFWSRYRARRGEVSEAIGRVHPPRHTGIGVTAELRELARRMDEWRLGVSEQVMAPDRLSRKRLFELTTRLAAASAAAYPADPPRRKRAATARQKSSDDRRRSLQYDLHVLDRALTRFDDFLEADAARAAETGALLLTGEAGQGKTHLICDVGERAVEVGRPAAVLLGGRFAGRRVWSDIAQQLGLGEIGSDVLLGGMRAAAEASNAGFLLFIDALNEAAEPEAWKEELPALFAELADDPWISVGVSVRTTFLPVVLPDAGLGDGVAEVEHPGFRGRELEATERFFDHYGLEQPRIPLLTPEFTNPLFLKLYCEGLHGLGLSAAPSGEAQISDVFARYITWKSKRITGELKLDPEDKPVERALDAFSAAMVELGRDAVPRDRARDVIDGVAPDRTEWPRTLFGQLLNEGVLTSDLAWDRVSEDYKHVIRFSYQRFADYRAVASLLAPYGSLSALRSALAPGKPLRAQVLHAPAGWIEALSVQLPERFGIELFDAARWRLMGNTPHIWDRSLVRSVLARQPTAVSDRTRELLGRAQRRTRGLFEDVLETMLALAPNPDHPLNGNRLHARLMSWSMADRDVLWSVPTYFSLGNEGALDRLIRWASRGPYADAPAAVVELAAIPLIWTFTSPNRRLRDYATKALRRLLVPHLAVVAKLIERFRRVDDPYVLERLAVVAHGVVLTGGASDPDGAPALARILADAVLDDFQPPNILSRDAARGAVEWCVRAGLMDESEYDAVVPPYQSEPPSKPRTKRQLENAYDRNRKDRSGNYIPSRYGAIFSSLFDLGDFGRYIVESKVRRFTQYPLGRPRPEWRPPKSPRIDEKKLAEFEATLSGDQRDVVTSSDDFSDIIDSLDRGQRLALLQALDPPKPIDKKASYPAELAERWIFERVLSLGWTPERFYDFERYSIGGSLSRSGHKRERFGKKYQWIALRELVARLADNFHMTEPYSNDRVDWYQGPWQFFGRDIDPTLPPAPRRRNDEDELIVEETFAPDDGATAWWLPPGPRYLRDDPMPPDDWATDPADVPTFEPLVRKEAPDRSRWVVLQAYYNWDEEKSDDPEQDPSRVRDQWSHIYSWLVEPTDRAKLVSYLESKSLMGRWMPEAREHTDGAYLAEMPWAASTMEYPDRWEELWPRGQGDPIDLKVYPTWVQYYWEGNVYDESIDDGVRAVLPEVLLFETGELRWIPETRDWQTPSGETVAQYRHSLNDRHSALLVRESWLKRVLKSGGWELVVGWLGEKQLFRGGFDRGLIGEWSQIDGIATLDGSMWSFGNRRIEHLSHH